RDLHVTGVQTCALPILPCGGRTIKRDGPPWGTSARPAAIAARRVPLPPACTAAPPKFVCIQTTFGPSGEEVPPRCGRARCYRPWRRRPLAPTALAGGGAVAAGG